MLKHICIVVLMAFASRFALAQESYTISGMVTDGKNPIPGAAVYVSNYKIAAETNSEGKFTLPKLPAGSYDILVQMMGFKPYSVNVVLSNRAVSVAITLTDNPILLNQVTIKPDPNRAHHLTLFKNFFVGQSPAAAQCKILNLHLLTFNDDRSNRILTASASDFLIIENQALGYRIKYLLEAFEYDYRTKVIFYSGYPYFEELNGSASKKKRWQRNREIAYKGSIQHFYHSLYHGDIEKQGFTLYKLIEQTNTQRPPDSVIKKNIQRLTAGQNGVKNILTFNGTDSLSFWLRHSRAPKTVTILNRSQILLDTLVKPYDNDLKKLQFSDALYVIYKNEKETAHFNSLGFKINRPPDIGDFQISLIRLSDPFLLFYANGGVFDPRSAIYSGYWAYEKVADLLPMDYMSVLKSQ